MYTVFVLETEQCYCHSANIVILQWQTMETHLLTRRLQRIAVTTITTATLHRDLQVPACLIDEKVKKTFRHRLESRGGALLFKLTPKTRPSDP